MSKLITHCTNCNIPVDAYAQSNDQINCWSCYIKKLDELNRQKMCKEIIDDFGIIGYILIGFLKLIGSKRV